MVNPIDGDALIEIVLDLSHLSSLGELDHKAEVLFCHELVGGGRFGFQQLSQLQFSFLLSWLVHLRNPLIVDSSHLVINSLFFLRKRGIE